MATKKQRFQSITISPSDGGQLITRASEEHGGVANYFQKRDFRRDLDQEMRREGYDYFWPNQNKAVGGQPFPGQVTLASITRSGTTATAVTTPFIHHLEVGEAIIISGTNSSWDGTYTIATITSESFTFTVPNTLASTAPGSPVVCPVERINFLHLARRPNGKTAVLSGSPRRLYRYYSLENPSYYEGDGTSDEYFYTNTGDDANAPYYETEAGSWIVIGWGFSTSGNRWECVNINGYAIMSNGVDLPVSYRVEEMETVPIYELREQGIASVGTISEYNGILMLADIREIDADSLADNFALVGDISSGQLTASQSGTTVTTEVDFFVNSMAGKHIVYSDGTDVTINTVNNARSVTVLESHTVTDLTFKLRTKASQTGSTYSGLITASVADTTNAVVASSNFFSGGMVGKTIRFTNGFESVIATFTDATHITMVDTWNGSGDNITGEPFWIIDPATSYTVTAQSSFFTPAMVGRVLAWEDGSERTITSYIGSLQVEVDSDVPVASGYVGLNNLDTYALYTGIVDRVQFRLLWAMNDEPRRFAATVPGSIQANSRVLTLDYPIASIEAGDEIIIIGAGVNGGNLTTTINTVTGGNKVYVIDDPASTTVTSQLVQQSDAVTSIVGYQDLQDDGSGILKMLSLQDVHVIYKDTAIFLARYTGISTSPFAFQRIVVDNGKTLFFRHTLVSVGAEWHLFAGASSFYRFDLTNLKPLELPLFEAASNLFFNTASLEAIEQIFAADNEVTKEILFKIASPEGDDQVLIFDYKQSTLSTSSMQITAAATVKRPETALSAGATPIWFVMGNDNGTVLLYGRTNEAEPIFDSGKEIYYRRGANPYNEESSVAYDSVLEADLGDFGDGVNEKDLTQYVLQLSSESPDSTPAVVIDFYGVRNPGEAPTLLGSKTLATPKAKNMIPLFFVQQLFAEKITVSEIGKTIRITSRSYTVGLIWSRSFIRH